MEESSDNPKDVGPNSTNQASTTKNKQKIRSAKRRRASSSESDNELPDNMLETERSIHASAVKNNLDNTCVRKIIKKVVADGRVFAMVKLKEEEENELSSNIGTLPTTITRSKRKELMKASPKTAPWNLELTPIKHIPVKTRPEVTALIAQDLPEDEDDDEYKPTHEDVPSDDDQTLESCSDLESQPHTPATPNNLDASSPKVVQDGPFKVPQNISATKRKLELEEEEATIARRTRSKLSLSSTSIEHIESTFVPPDDIPMPDVDDLWNEFLNECLNPASTSKHEDDDEADPEYNAAADADAVDEDDENLSNSIIKISKKELNDLVTELIAVMPEETSEDLAENLVNSVLTDANQREITQWEGKQEPPSDEEAKDTVSDRPQPEKTDTLANFSFGKTEPEDEQLNDGAQNDYTNIEKNEGNTTKQDNVNRNDKNGNRIDESVNKNNESAEGNDDNKPDGDTSDEDVIIVEIKNEDIRNDPETNGPVTTKAETITELATIPPLNDSAPPLIRHMMKVQSVPVRNVVVLPMDVQFVILPEQIQIFQQQLRQHIQLATSNFLQLYIHPIHWHYASVYKEYVESFVKLCQSKPNSVGDVCNLKPALELICSWESTVAENTPENKEMVKFIDAESKRSRHRNMNHSAPSGDFPEQVKRVVANSAVFLYPHLLPPTPYRPDQTKRFAYSVPEDHLIALGLDQFWTYVESNKKMFKIRRHSQKQRPGLTVVIEQMGKYMFPWMTPRHLLMHVHHVRKHVHSENPINVFFKKNKVDPVKHKLLPFNPQMTLYEHPESEIPRPWLRYLAKTSKRFKKCFTRTDRIIHPTTGVPVELGSLVEAPKKNPLPIDFTQQIGAGPPNMNLQDKFDVTVSNPKPDPLVAANLFSVVQTSTGLALVPLMVQETNVVNSQVGPITTPAEVQSNVIVTPIVPETRDNVTNEVIEKSKEKTPKNVDGDHCECCVMLRKICKGPKLITDYFEIKNPSKKECQCRDRKFPKVSNRLKILLTIYKSQSSVMLKELEDKLKNDTKDAQNDFDADDLEYAVLFQMRYLVRLSVKLTHLSFKKRLYALFSNFNVDTDDPVKLAEKLYKDLKNDLFEVFAGFLGFLTAEQAEDIGGFDHYLVSYMNFIMKRIDKEVTDLERRKAILTQLKQWFSYSKELTTCQICKSVLTELKDYPRLAQYVFSLFPHKKHTPLNTSPEAVSTSVEAAAPPDEQTPTPDEQIPTADEETPTPDEETPTNQEEETTSSESESSEPGPALIGTSSECKMDVVVKEEPTSASEEESTNVGLTASNEESPDDSRETPENSMVIAEEETHIDNQEWSREDDKMLLEVIKKYLATEETKDKSIFKTLQENKVYELIAERLTDKSMDNIVQRVLYLLEVLVVNS